MKQLAVDIFEITPDSLEIACIVLERELKRRRHKVSFALPLPSPEEFCTVKVVKRGPYTFRYIEALGCDRVTPLKLVGRLDTLYGKQVTEALR